MKNVTLKARLLIVSGLLLGLLGCNSLPKQYINPTPNAPKALVTVELDIPKKTPIIGVNTHLHLSLLDEASLLAGDACEPKLLSFSKDAYKLNAEKLLIGTITATDDMPSKTVEIAADRSYFVDLNRLRFSSNHSVSEYIHASFTPKPNTHYIFRYKGIIASDGTPIGEFQTALKHGNHYSVVPETDLYEIEPPDCNTIMNNKTKTSSSAQ